MDLDRDSYDEIDACNFSTVKHADKSALHYKHAVEAEDRDTVGRMLGRLTHAAVLEPDTLLRDWVVYDGDRRGKAFSAFCEQHPNQGIIKPAELEGAFAMRDAVRSHPAAGPILERGRAEVSIVWTDEATGLPLKGRIDWISESVPCVLDLKGTRSIEARRFAADVAQNLYHVQAALYRRGLRANGIDLPMKLLAVEIAPPHDCAVFALDEDTLWAADEKVTELLARVAAGRFSGRWPGRYDSEQTLVLPSWAFPQTNDDALAGLILGGEEEAA